MYPDKSDRTGSGESLSDAGLKCAKPRERERERERERKKEPERLSLWVCLLESRQNRRISPSYRYTAFQTNERSYLGLLNTLQNVVKSSYLKEICKQSCIRASHSMFGLLSFVPPLACNFARSIFPPSLSLYLSLALLRLCTYNCRVWSEWEWVSHRDTVEQGGRVCVGVALQSRASISPRFAGRNDGRRAKRAGTTSPSMDASSFLYFVKKQPTHSQRLFSTIDRYFRKQLKVDN